MDNSSLPGCFSLGKAVAPNNCENCRFSEDCRKYILKDALKPILAKVEKIEAILKS